MTEASGAGAGWRAAFWRWVGAPLFAWTPHPTHNIRRALLGLAGARVARTAKIRRSASIDRPWNLTLGELAIIGDDAILRLREPLRVGARSVVSQRCLVSTEMIDPEDPPGSVRAPIDLGDDCWVAADTLVMPGSRVRAGSVIGARGVVVGELPGWSVCVGMPAVARRGRRFISDEDRAARERGEGAAA